MNHFSTFFFLKKVCSSSSSLIFNVPTIYRLALRNHSLFKSSLFGSKPIFNMDKAPFNGKLNYHRNVIIESCDITTETVEDFEKVLDCTLNKYIEEKVRGVWFKLGIDQVQWIPILIKKGFKIHHARDETISLCIWLDKEEPSKIPDYAHYFIGAGAVVINDKRQVLVVREQHRKLNTSYWKLPGGHANRGEDPVNAAIREVMEETSVKTEFSSVTAIRWGPKGDFPECSDMYFVVRLKPLSQEIIPEKSEIEDCKWMDVDEYLNHPLVHANNRFFVQQAIQNEESGVLMERKYDLHPVSKTHQYLYSLRYEPN